MLSREPLHRPIDVMILEVVLSLTQALLVGVLLWLAAGFWSDRGVPNGPVLLALALLGLAVGAAWLSWLVGGLGWPMAALNIPVALIMGAVLLLGLAGADTGRMGVGLAAFCLAFALLGIVCGFFLPGPHRPHWKDGMSRPRRTASNAPPPRVTPTTERLLASMAQQAGTIRRFRAEPLPDVSAEDLAASTATSSTLTPSASGSLPAVASSKAAADATLAAPGTTATSATARSAATAAGSTSVPPDPTPTAGIRTPTTSIRTPTAGIRTPTTSTPKASADATGSTSVAPTVAGSLPGGPLPDPRTSPPPDTRPWPRPPRPPQP